MNFVDQSAPLCFLIKKEVDADPSPGMGKKKGEREANGGAGSNVETR